MVSVPEEDKTTFALCAPETGSGDVKRSKDSGLRLFAYTLLYTGDCIESDLQDIAAKASRNNPRDGITGVLLFDAGRFIQVVEGPEESIDRLVNRIGRDPRGTEMHILFDQRILARSMEQWDMWVGRLGGHDPIDTDEIERFRRMYERSLRLEAHGFIYLLLKLIEGEKALEMEKSP